MNRLFSWLKELKMLTLPVWIDKIVEPEWHKHRKPAKYEPIEYKKSTSSTYCWNMLNIGYCKYGNKCRYEHNGTQYLKPVVCNEYKMLGKCRFGDKCLFNHGIPLPSEVPMPKFLSYK